MSPSSSPEWYLFRNLGWYLNGRLQSAERQIRLGRSLSRLEIKCRVLEVDLRDALMLKNFDANLPGSSQDDASEQCESECLGQIVELLESHINIHLVPSWFRLKSSPEYIASSVFGKYPELYRLIQYLKETTEDFHTTAGPFNLVLDTSGCPAIFSIGSLSLVQQLLEKVTDLNSYLRRIQSQPGTITGKRSRNLAGEEENTPSDNQGDFLFRRHTGAVFGALHQFLACGKSHKIMLQLQEQEGALDLFMSDCSDTERWQEVQCECHTPAISRQINNLCETLQGCADQRLQIVVEVLGDDSHSIHFSTQPASRLYPQASPSETLEGLIKTGRFQNINFRDRASLHADRFTLREKRILALRLGLCFLNFFDAEFMRQSWNPGKIMFLVLPKRKIQESLLYICCSLQETREEEGYSPGHPVLTSFAKLLLEIDEGQSWLPPDGDASSSPSLIWTELCKYVEKAKKHYGGNSYLDAITGALHLYIELNEAERSREEGEDIDAKVRDLIYRNIIKHLEQEVSPETRKRPKIAVNREISKMGNFKTSHNHQPLGIQSHGINRGESLDATSESRFRKMSQRETLSLHSRGSYPRDIEIHPIRTLSHSSNLPRDIPTDNRQTSQSQPRIARQPHSNFHIAIICALPLEADAMQALFDKTYEESHETPRAQNGDQNIYTMGKIGHHNVVLCHLPGMGASSAASAAANLRVSYTGLKIVLIVGICGANPSSSKGEEVLLGDIIISDRMIKSDFGRQYSDRFERKGGSEEILGPHNSQIRALLKKLETKIPKHDFQTQTTKILRKLQKKGGDEYNYPGTEHDILFPPNHLHKPYRQDPISDCVCSRCATASEPLCEEIRKKDCRTLGCVDAKIQQRRRTRRDTLPLIHIGTMASADTVMKSGKHRDELAAKEGVIGFEMEGAGVWGQLSACIVIKGVCDYADSHKNKMWQQYAAATAAAGATAFLNYWAVNTGSSNG